MTNKNSIVSLKSIRWVSIILIVILAGFLLLRELNPPIQQATQSSGRAAIGGNFTLTNHHGEEVTQADFLGKPALLFFGFTHCPDICPTALQQMGVAMQIMGKDAPKVQTILITVDPQRDTPELLAQYVSLNGFPENLVGLTGTDEQIEAVAKTWAVYYQRSGEADEDYDMDHSTIIFLMAANGEFVTGFSHNDSPELIASCLTNHLAGRPCRR